jgi:hypothetical protein
MNNRIARKLRKLAQDQTNQRPEYYDVTYKRMKEVYLHGSEDSRRVLRKALNSI